MGNFMVYKFMENSSELQQNNQSLKLPFQNLFLNAGVVYGKNKLWMYLFGVVAVIAGYAFGQVILTIPLIRIATANGITLKEIMENNYILFDPEMLGINKNIILLIEFGFFVFAFLSFYLAVKLIHKKPFLSVVTAFEKFRYNHFFFAFLLWSFILVTAMVVTYMADSESVTLQFDAGKFAVLFILCILFLPFQTLIEEVFFRGYLIQGMAQVFKNGIVPLVISSAFFGMAHMSNPEIAAYGKWTMFAYYVVFAMFLGAITLLDEGLELAYGIHLSNNLVSALMVTSKHSVLKTDAIFYTQSEDATAELVLAFCSIVAVFVIFWIKYRWKSFSLLIK